MLGEQRHQAEQGGVNADHWVTFRRIAADLRAPWYREEWRSGWAVALLYRVPSLPLVWLFARAGWSPLAVSGLALLVALSLPALALFLPLSAAPWAVLVAGILFQILDCADGILARVTGRASPRGGDVDFLVDMVQWGLLYLSLGILADRIIGGGAAIGWGWTALALLAAWGRLLARVIRDRLEGAGSDVPAPLRPVDWIPAFVAGLSGLIPILALAGSWLGIGIAALLVYSALDIADGLTPLVAGRRRQ